MAPQTSGIFFCTREQKGELFLMDVRRCENTLKSYTSFLVILQYLVILMFLYIICYYQYDTAPSVQSEPLSKISEFA